jgi:hypothetical protein
MPGDFHYLDESEIVISSYWGTVTLVDILETITRRAREMPSHHAEASVIDTTEARWTDVPPKFVREQVQSLRPALAPPKVRTVFIAPGEFFNGFARMYALMHSIYGAANVEVVRSWDEASKLLGVDLAEAQQWAKERAAKDDATRPSG